VRFSGRLSQISAATEPNAWTRLLLEKRAAGARLLDLTLSNPTETGIAYPEDAIRAALGPDGALRYQPDPRGLRSAREAVAAAAGAPVEDVLLTVSTSEAYSYLLKLFCNPGDAVLVPEPSYPLFEHLTALEGVAAAPYRLAYDGAWHIDFSTVRAGAARAIIVVSPNNPTGSYLKTGELARLAALGLPLIVDEVFADYPLAPPSDAVHLAARPNAPVLTFSLGGLSKSAGLPQLKLGWIVAGGPGRAAALDKLELIADCYLSVATPVQLAAPKLLALGAEVRDAIRARVRRNRDALAARLPPSLTLLPAEAGWSAILRFPATRSDEELALALLRDHDTLVHPGYFFDLTGGTFLVVSLLPTPEMFDAGTAAIIQSS